MPAGPLTSVEEYLHSSFRPDREFVDGSGTENIWGKRADWVDYSTTLHDDKAGVAIFDHPSNPGYPTYWHARGYGLCTANPFGVRNFTGDESKDGTMEVPEGGELKFHYRLVIHPGSAGEAKVAELYAQFQSGS